MARTTGIEMSRSEDIHFLLYRKRNPSKNTCTEIIPGDRQSITNSGFDANKKTKVLIHGFLAHAFTEFPRNVKDAYLQQEDFDYNVICINWSPLSGKKVKDYEDVQSQLTTVAKGVTAFLRWLHKRTKLDLSNLHLVGHSLGAHVCGLVGKAFKDKETLLLGRISALDPAGYNYGPGISHRMCDKNDARFVDAYHTTSVLGTTEEVGHVDFFIQLEEPRSYIRGLMAGIYNHSEAHRIFARTIRDGPGKNVVEYQTLTSDTYYITPEDTIGSCDLEYIPVDVGEYCSDKTKGRVDVDGRYKVMSLAVVEEHKPSKCFIL